MAIILWVILGCILAGQSASIPIHCYVTRKTLKGRLTRLAEQDNRRVAHETGEGECPHEPCSMSRTPRQNRGARLNGDRAIRERRRHIVTPNTESLRKGTFAEAARYVVMRPWLPSSISSVKKRVEPLINGLKKFLLFDSRI